MSGAGDSALSPACADASTTAFTIADRLVQRLNETGAEDVRLTLHRAGDTLDVQFYKGAILLRKHLPLTPEQCAALLERSSSQPEPMADDDATVADAIPEVRASRR